MDLEAMQFLNLSPIPESSLLFTELSEIELSTMLDHLSGLSDINGDLTDRNVEDIIKEAEDLLDRTISSKTNDSNDKKSSQAGEIKSDVISENAISLKENEESITEETNSSKIKHHNNPANDTATLHNTSNEEDSSKHFNSPVETTSTKVYSPGSTTNHIKSTLDSLKEFSTLIEKKLSSPKDNNKVKQNEKVYENAQLTVVDSPSKFKLLSKSQLSSIPKTMKESQLTKNNQSFDKSIKLLNCFERLYQVKPARLATSKKPKVTDRAPKPLMKKKLIKDFKNVKKSNWQGKTNEDRIVGNTKSTKICGQPVVETFLETDELLKENKISPKVISNNQNYSQISNTESKTTVDCITQPCDSFRQNYYGQVQSRIDEKLILKVLEEMEEIKDQVRKVGAIADGQIPGRMIDDSGTKPRKPEIESTEKITIETANNSGIKRLEQQFSVLKQKYDCQMEKLEAENCRLREALSSQEKFFPSQINENSISKLEENRLCAEHKSLSSLSLGGADKKITRSLSLENCRAPKNSPSSSIENLQGTIAVREAFSQTEQDIAKTCKAVGTDAEIFAETRKTDNKENVTLKKRPGKCKPFSDVNVHQTARQKKMDDHESQLLATLRGLQAEVTAKDKENRKLKSEIESLKKQMKKLPSTKVENWRKCHSGTQTIGLGPIVQKPYIPEQYEAPQEFEKENEDLRSRIKALEEDFELLKEKRISDLQALHQVHEEEMAKLVSKLETQSALTRHLHSLLVNR